MAHGISAQGGYEEDCETENETKEEKMRTDMKMRLVELSIITAILLISFLINGCANANSSDRPTAERVFTTESGYVCFIIRDETGKGIGGNCLRD